MAFAFFKDIQYGCEIFQNVKPTLKYLVATSLKLLPLIDKRFYNLLYKPIYDLAYLLSYCESINNHS